MGTSNKERNKKNVARIEYKKDEGGYRRLYALKTTLLCVFFVFSCQPLLSLSPSMLRSPAPAL